MKLNEVDIQRSHTLPPRVPCFKLAEGKLNFASTGNRTVKKILTLGGEDNKRKMKNTNICLNWCTRREKSESNRIRVKGGNLVIKME